jgi:hypothetical protein
MHLLPELDASSCLRDPPFPAKRRGEARLAQLVERKALNLVVVGSSPTVGEPLISFF